MGGWGRRVGWGWGDAEDVEGVQLAVTRAQYDTLSDNEIIKTAHQTTSAICWPSRSGRGGVVCVRYWD